MKVQLSWLKQYAGINLPVEKLTGKLIMHGLEVDQVIDRRHDFDNVVIGQVLAVKPHPNAEKLRLVSTLIAKGGTPQEIVCGAPNVAAGQKVAVAMVGAKLPNGMTIEARDIRGVTSRGMICAEDELGLGKNHQGIMVLDSDFPVGMPLTKAFGFDEVVLDIDIPANRPDLLSVLGLAREIATILGIKYREAKELKLKKVSTGKSVAVKVANPKLCPVYTARVIRGVKIQSSPAPLQNCLLSAGIRPINNIVDATNFIMLKYGQPLHAFDAKKIKGVITIRPAKVGESLVTLDGQTRKLDPTMLVIADATGPLALAGVMGGANSEISSTTTDIVLESAIFDPVSIRRTSRRLGLVSEASKRFEKGLPATLPEKASLAAAAMITELGGGHVEGKLVTVGKVKAAAIVVTMAPDYISRLVGVNVLPAKAKAILIKLGFKVSGTAKKWKIIVPEWRLDITIPEDIVDEVGRMLGYENLPTELPVINTIPDPLPRLVESKEKIRDVLAGLGLTEVITHAYYGQPWAEKNQGRHFEIANPLDKAQQYLRKSLAQQINSVLQYAVDGGNDAKVFQIGRVFNPELPGQPDQQQPWKLCIGLAFKPTDGYVDGAKILGVVDALNDALGVSQRGSMRLASTQMKGRSIELVEMDLTELLNAGGQPVKKFQAVSTFPKVNRDISAFLPPHIDFQRIMIRLREVVDVKQPVRLDDTKADWFKKDGRTSITLHFIFQAPDRTLKKEEVGAVEKRIKSALIELGATIR